MKRMLVFVIVILFLLAVPFAAMAQTAPLGTSGGTTDGKGGSMAPVNDGKGGTGTGKGDGSMSGANDKGQGKDRGWHHHYGWRNHFACVRR